jgi:hypothetical protein
MTLAIGGPIRVASGMRLTVSAQHRTSGQHEAILKRAFAQTGHVLRHHHGRCGREIMRIHQLDQMLGEARELRAPLAMNTRSHKSNASSSRSREGQCSRSRPARPAGNLGKLLGNLGADLTQITQLRFRST